MKIRKSFVANSSSSSFLIAAKKKPTKKDIMKILKVPEDSPIYHIAEEIAVVLSNCDNIDEDNCCDEEFINKAKEKGLKVFYGSSSDDCDPIETLVCNMEISYESDDFMLEKEGHY